MKKALILGTNAGQADIIEYLKEIGWEVHACGYKREGPGCDLADQFHLVNTIDIDAVVFLAKRIQADVVYSVSSDSAIKSATKVSEVLGLPFLVNSAIIELFDKKELLRKFLNEKQICSVAYTSVSDISDLQSWDVFPCVVKPSDSQGQRGVRLIENKKDFFDAVTQAIAVSQSKRAIIEEYFSGTEMSSNVIVQKGKIVVNEFTERYIHGKHFFGLPKGHAIPVRNIASEGIAVAKQMIEDMVDVLQLKEAVLYVQMVATPSGPKIIEVAPRLDGCHIWRMIRFAKGYDLRAYAINALLGINIEHKEEDRGLFTLLFNQIASGEHFHRDAFQQTEKQAVYQEYRYSEGDEIVPINGKLEVVGYYVLQN